LIQQIEVPDVEGAIRAAGQLDGPMVLKAIVPGLLHKSDAGGVRLNLHGPQAVGDAAAQMAERLHPTGFLLQRMSPPGVELLVGVVHDAQFGPLLACGAGGTLVELMKDVTVALTPVNEDDIRQMLQRLKIYPMLNGYRGAPACDVAALRDAILRIGLLADDLPEILELDCNPIIVHEHGAAIVDARVRLGGSNT
jgi:acyl-CoA synthetase (NDP forming)